MSERVVAPELEAAAREVAAIHLGVAPEAVSLERLQERRADRPIFRAWAGERELVTKQYLEDEFLAGSALRLQAAAPLAAHLEIPRLIGTDTGRRIFVMSVVRGEPLLEHLANGTRDPGPASERAGAAIGRVHGSGIAFPGQRLRHEMIEQIRSMSVVDEDRERFTAALALAERLLAAAPRGPLVPSHGDLGPDQMLVCDDRIGMLDFDKATMAEAARDLGYFLAHLLRDVPEAAPALRGRFLGGYATLAVTPSGEAIDGYAILVLLRKLARSTAPRSTADQERRGDRPRSFKTANLIRPAIDRIIGGGATGGRGIG